MKKKHTPQQGRQRAIKRQLRSIENTEKTLSARYYRFINRPWWIGILCFVLGWAIIAIVGNNLPQPPRYQVVGVMIKILIVSAFVRWLWIIGKESYYECRLDCLRKAREYLRQA